MKANPERCYKAKEALEVISARIELNADDRVLILAPHPDDETLGCGGIIQRAVGMRVPLQIIFFTHGDYNDWSFILYRKRPIILPRAVKAMGDVRHNEAIAAAGQYGVSRDNLVFLGYPDFGTLHMWLNHWGDGPPYRSILTKATRVPYSDALRPGAEYRAEEILKDLSGVIREFKPTKIFVSHPGDHHPDHLALYLFMRVALWDLKTEVQPSIFPYLIHLHRWPIPRGLKKERPLLPPRLFGSDISWKISDLDTEMGDRKLAALRQHKTQFSDNAKYLLSFIRTNELFGDFPVAVLHSKEPSSITANNSTDADSTEPLEELTIAECAEVFVGIENRTVRIERDYIVFGVSLTRPLSGALGVSTYIFGYRADIPFYSMPKVQIHFNALGYKIIDGNRALGKDTIEIRRRLRRITFRIPIQVLGNPERVLLSARSYLGEVLLDWTSWRALEIAPQI